MLCDNRSMAKSDFLKCAGIYRITVKRAEKPRKLYIGQASEIGGRLRCHLSALRRGVHGNMRLKNAFNKYGRDAFSLEVVLVCKKEHLTLYEQAVLDFHLQKGDGVYNCKIKCVESPTGFRHSAITRSRMSADRAGRKLSDEARERISSAQTLRYQDRREREKISLRMKGNKNGEGAKFSDERRARISAKASSRTIPEEIRLKISKKLSGKTLSDEVRAKMSVGQFRRWDSRRLNSIVDTGHMLNSVDYKVD